MGVQPLKVLYVATEVVPFAKTGGLADVAGSLPKGLAALGLDVRIAMPKYKDIQADSYLIDFPVRVNGRLETAVIRQGEIETEAKHGRSHVPVYFVDNYQYFQRNDLYGYPDDGERWAFFSRALLEMINKIDFVPDILHLNDWQVGPAAAMMQAEYRKLSRYRHIAVVITVHNLKYQGLFGRDILRVLKLQDDLFRPEALEFYGQVNFLKAGLVFSDVINTVSPTYAKEIRTREFGEGLDGVLRNREDDLFGIINGIDTHQFNPATDPFIPYRYSADDWAAKGRNKSELQRELGLPVKDVPIFGLVSRLVEQKGLDLITQISEDMMREDLQFVILGQGDPRYEAMFRLLKKCYPEKVGVHIGFDAPLAQRVYAGSDLFLMPSRFEPCGLGQLISLRYGTIPIVRLTGGLADTIIDYDSDEQHGNGFIFVRYEAAELMNAIQRGLKLYQNRDQWLQLVKYVMGLDFSWQKSAMEYASMYRKAREKVLEV